METEKGKKKELRVIKGKGKELVGKKWRYNL